MVISHAPKARLTHAQGAIDTGQGSTRTRQGATRTGQRPARTGQGAADTRQAAARTRRNLRSHAAARRCTGPGRGCTRARCGSHASKASLARGAFAFTHGQATGSNVHAPARREFVGGEFLHDAALAPHAIALRPEPLRPVVGKA